MNYNVMFRYPNGATITADHFATVASAPLFNLVSQALAFAVEESSRVALPERYAQANSRFSSVGFPIGSGYRISQLAQCLYDLLTQCSHALLAASKRLEQMAETQADAGRSLAEVRSALEVDLCEILERALQRCAMLCATLLRHDQLTYEELVALSLWSLVKLEGAELEPTGEDECAEEPVHQSSH